MLSTFNLPGKNISTDKQMSMMRTYLGNLKDELETELYNIKWENLSKDLRELITSLEKYKADSGERLDSISANYVDADYLTANYATFGWVQANYATFSYLSSHYADFDWVNSNFATFGYVDTNFLTAAEAVLTYATITNLNAVDGKFNNLNANNITSGTINSARLNADDIAANMFQSRIVVANGIQVYGNNGTGIGSNTYVSASTYVRCGSQKWEGNVATVKDINGYSRTVPVVVSA